MTIASVITDLQIAFSNAQAVNSMTTITDVVNAIRQALTDAQSMQSSDPAWRVGLTVGVWAPIVGSSMKNMVPESPGATIDTWNGLAAVSDATRAMWVSAANGGHTDSSDNGVYGIDFLQAAPKWATLHAPTPAAERPTSAQSGAGMPAVPYDSDGQPNSCHSYFSLQFCPQRNRIIRPFSSALWYAAQSSECMDGFDLAGAKWDAAGTFPNCLTTAYAQSVTTDPNTGDIYVGALSTFTSINAYWAKWTQAANTWAAWITTGPFGIPGYHGIAIDAKRNRLVRSGETLNGDTLANIPWIDLATSVCTLSPTGITTAPRGERTITHDSDADVYYMTDSVSVWSINPTTFAATLVAPLPVKAVNGVQSRFAYFPLLKGIVYYPNFTSDLYFYPTA